MSDDVQSGTYALRLNREMWWVVEVCAETQTTATRLSSMSETDVYFDHVEGCDLAAVKRLRATWDRPRPVWGSLEAVLADYPHAVRWPEADTFA